ncbi:galactosylceramide sulfotransferase-like [Mercenaria mercenaria]|uniref:galactosylceramide sulfotransferase-like n=1 Tax=Mercenaria mercenaria TaxID=6596 RepID=UPI00234F41EC|nr:galactosylceramide sulfotransferase-like [Mercenaria mercenaria]
MPRKMCGRIMKISGCIVLVAIATTVTVLMGPTKTEYAAVVRQIDGSYLKYSGSNKFNVTMETTGHHKLQISTFERSETRVKTYPDNTNNQQQQRKQEVRHIGFLKVHKAASSTMQNMFFRFGLKRNLTYVFTVHPNYFSRTAQRHLPLVKPRYRKGYDIICNHGVFNYDIYSSLLPKDTVYLAIVRDPLAVFISAVNYYSQKSQQIYYIARIRGNRLQKLIQKPEVYDREFFSYTKNVMARDFGFPETNDQSRIEAKLKELDQVFKLVLLVEHIEESLILMKRYLNWKLKDILFLSNNVYGKGQTGADLTLADTEKFKIRNKLDYAVYNFFYKKFWDQYNSETDDINSEVKHFKSVLFDLNTFCNNKAHENDGSVLTVNESKWTEQFTVIFEDCKYMNKDELEFIKLLRQKQGSELRG